MTSRDSAGPASRRGLVLVRRVAAVAAGCAERIGKQAAAGAVAELQKEHASSADDPGQQPARIAGERAVEGAVTALDAPEQRARIERIVPRRVSVAAATAVEKATRQLVAELGPDGEGPLAVSLSRTGERVSAAAVGGRGRRAASSPALLPECNGPDRLGCIEQRLQQTARSTAASFTAGVKDTIGWQLLLVAFALGAGGGVLGAWLWSLRSVERRRGFRRTA